MTLVAILMRETVSRAMMVESTATHVRKMGLACTCSECMKVFPTSQHFAAHAAADHYKYETKEQRRKRQIAPRSQGGHSKSNRFLLASKASASRGRLLCIINQILVLGFLMLWSIIIYSVVLLFHNLLL